MLPPILDQIRQRLVAKGYSSRTAAEDQLLEELEILDKDPQVDFSVKSKQFRAAPQVVAGPGGVCSCCGR
jgi:hypothetical protein